MTDDHPDSPLAEFRYGRRALDLSRFVNDPADDGIADFVRTASAQSPEKRDELRDGLDEDDCYSLLNFARRRSAAAIRDGSLTGAREAIQALTLVTLSKIDFRDLSVDFPVYALGQLGGDPAEAVKTAAAASEPGTRGSFAAMSGRAAPRTLEDCALIEVVSRYGRGFMETWAKPYTPQSDLTGIAVRIADHIDAGGRYEVDDLHLSSLPLVWFSRDPKPIGEIPVSGCVSISASIPGRSRWEHGLLLFLAEVEATQSASTLVERAEAGSTSDRPRVAANDGRLLLVLIGGSTTRGQKPLETEATLRLIREDLLDELRR